MASDDRDLRSLHETLDPKARDTLRRVLIHDQPDRDAIASNLLRYRDELGDGWADIIDMHDASGGSAAGGAIAGEIEARD